MTATLLLGALSVVADGQPIDVIVECPLGLETRIVFPEAVIELRTPPAAVVRALRLRVVAAGPKAIISLSPSTTPLDAVVVFEGSTAKLRVQIRTIPTGKSQEHRLPAPGEEKPPAAQVATSALARVGESSPPRGEAPPKSEPPPAATRLSRSGRRSAEGRPEQHKGKGAEKAKVKREAEPLYEETEAVVPPASSAAPAVSPEEVVVLRPVWVAPPDPAPASPPPALAARPGPSPGPHPAPGVEPMSAPFDGHALALARPQRIGREEGLPGQSVTVLEDALRGSALIWLRFRVRGGAKGRVDGVRWERGEIKSVLIEPDGRDLRVVVQLPRAGVTKSTRVELRVDGVDYKFAVSAPWFSSFLRSLF